VNLRLTGRSGKSVTLEEVSVSVNDGDRSGAGGCSLDRFVPITFPMFTNRMTKMGSRMTDWGQKFSSITVANSVKMCADDYREAPPPPSSKPSTTRPWIAT